MSCGPARPDPAALPLARRRGGRYLLLQRDAGRSAGWRPKAASRPGNPPSIAGRGGGLSEPPVHTPPSFSGTDVATPAAARKNFSPHGIRACLHTTPVALGRPSAPADRARDLADAGLTVLGRPSTLGCPRPAGRILGLPWPACRYLLAEPMAMSASVSRRRSRRGP